MSKRVTAKQKATAAKYARAAGLKVTSAKVGGYGSYYKKSYNRTPVRRGVRGYGKYSDNYGSRLGGVLGEGAERLFDGLGGLGGIGKLVGFGDYAPHGFAIKKNSLMDSLNGGNDPPVVQNGKNDRVVIRHREYLQDIQTSATPGAFTIQRFPINPGQQQTFPWLAQIAQAFEQYRLEGMIFEFKSTSANALNSTNTALGTVIMATEYDSSRPSFVNKMQMENHQYASSARQSSSMLHPIECDRSQTPITELYVRTSGGGDDIDNDTDLRLMDWGSFQIATVGGQAQCNIGELWVTYQVSLLKPCMSDVGAIQQASYFESIDGSYSNLQFFGTAATRRYSSANNAGIDIIQANQAIMWPKGTLGKYLVQVEWVGTVDTVLGLPTVTSGTTQGTTIDTAFSEYAPHPTNTGRRLMMSWTVDVYPPTGAGAGTNSYIALTSGTGTLPGTPTTVKLYVAAVYDKITGASIVAPGPLPLSIEDITDDESGEFKKFIMSQINGLREKYEKEKEKETPKIEEVRPEDLKEKYKEFKNLDQQELLDLFSKMKGLGGK